MKNYLNFHLLYIAIKLCSMVKIQGAGISIIIITIGYLGARGQGFLGTSTQSTSNKLLLQISGGWVGWADA